MNRREAIKFSGWITGTGLLVPGVFAALYSCQNSPKGENWQPLALTAEEVSQLKLLSDTIVPATETPSATDVRVHEFVDLVVADVLSDDQSQSVRDGLRVMNQTSISIRGDAFEDLTEMRRNELVTKIDTEAFAEESTGVYPDSFLKDYRYLKGLILMAYFTSEEGVKQNLNYVVLPGEYIGCMDLPEDHKITVGNHM